MDNKPFKYPEGGWLIAPGNRTPLVKSLVVSDSLLIFLSF